MNNFIKTNSSIVLNKLYKIADISTTTTTTTTTTTILKNKKKCPYCSSKFEQKYYYSNVESTDIIKSIEFTDLDLLALEFNHDEDLQKNSKRPQFLIERIMGNEGHLSNYQAVCFLDYLKSLGVCSQIMLRKRGREGVSRAS